MEIASDGILAGTFSGRLVRVNRNGSRTVLAGAGQVLRIQPR